MNSQNLIPVCAAAACFLMSTAVIANDDSKDYPQKAQARQFVDDRTFVNNAAICGAKEVRLATLASQKSTTESVKRFATQVITDHNAMQQELKKVALGEGYQLPSTDVLEVTASTQQTPPEVKETDPSKQANAAESSKAEEDEVAQYQKTFRKLQGLSGAQFDEAFVECMQKDHKAAIGIFEQAATAAKSPAVRQFAAYRVPVLKQHLATADQLSKELSEKTLTNR